MDDDIQRTAYHESGHAVMAAFLGAVVDRITIEPEYDDGPNRYGDTRVLWPNGRWSTKDLAVREIKVSLAGPVAEMIYDGDQYDPRLLAEWQCDWQTAVERAASFLPAPDLLVPYLQQMVGELIRFFDRNDVWAAVAGLADELEAHETLHAEDVAATLRVWRIE